MLDTIKRWVLTVLAMLAARAAPVPAPKSAALDGACAPRRRRIVGTKGVPPYDAKKPCRAGVEQKAV